MSDEYLDSAFSPTCRREAIPRFFGLFIIISGGLTKAFGHNYHIPQVSPDFTAFWLDFDLVKSQSSIAGKSRFVVSKGVEMNSRIPSDVLCPIEQVFAKGLA